MLIPEDTVFVEIFAFAALLTLAPGPDIHFAAILVVVNPPALAFSVQELTSVFNGVVFIILNPISGILVVGPLAIIPEEAVWDAVVGFGQVSIVNDRVETPLAVSLV